MPRKSELIEGKCSRCEIPFSSESAFDHHRRWRNGLLICNDPSLISKLRVSPDGVWSLLGETESWREVHFSE